MANVNEESGVNHVSISNQDMNNGLECILGCKIDSSKQVIPLTCLHFVCSAECVAKLKTDSKAGSLLTCKLCRTVIRPEHLEVKTVPENIFIKKKKLDSANLICENCVWERPASAYCAECPACLCQPCKELHPQTRATKNHVVQDDIAVQKAKYLEKLKEAEIKCTNHNQVYTAYCEKCSCKICSKCSSDHNGHTTFIIENEKKLLRSQIDIARKLTEKFDRAVEDIKSKRTEMLTSEWKNITTHINEHFIAMAKVLEKRHRELNMEAKDRFMKQLAALNMRSKCAEFSKESTKRFIKIGEDVLSNHHDDVAAIKFKGQYREYGEWLRDMDKKFTLEYNRYVDKDWHFKLDLTAESQAQKYLSEYCQIEYSYDKQSPAQTVSVNRESTDTGDSISGTGGACNNGDLKRSPSRRIAVKSTAAAQLSANKLKTLKTYPGKNLKINDQTTVLRASAKVKTVQRQDEIADAETETEDDEGTKEQNGVRLSKGNHESTLQEDVEMLDCSSVSDASDPEEVTLSCRPVLVNGRMQQKSVEGRGETSSRKNSSEKSKKEVETVSLSSPSTEGLESEKENSHEVVESSVELEQISALSAVTEIAEEAQTKSATDQGGSSPDKTRSDDISPESSMSTVSDTSELVVGKRERKKKSFPEFVNTDESFKILRKQQAEAASSAKVKRKFTPSKPNTPKANRLLQQQQQEHELKDDENGNVEQALDDDNVSVNTENGQDYESSDGYGSESSRSARRQSLRKRATQPSDTPPESLPRKKSRTISEDESTWLVPSNESIESAPELCDFPVKGQGRMKISNVDDNEDYCCICLDGGEEIIVCCDFCPKVFHLHCHLPVIKEIPEGEAKWRCNYDTTKETIDARIATFPDEEGSDQRLLTEANPRHFLLACKFVMECYKIPQSPTMRWIFPDKYLKTNHKAPVHLKYIRERLCRNIPEPFNGVEDMMRAFRQMFLQAFDFYRQDQIEHQSIPRYREAVPAAVTFFKTFKVLIEEYYPQHKAIFDDVKCNL